ncbi:MAG: glycosyltransferase family 39 protein [Candidatus Roizmanbacteria bacterium]|nr:glycosyltransferase family 39 protein [Candidatus Roizmanbacteria bacterium]
MTITFIFISAFLIRLINLNQSLWLDEAIVAKVVRSIPFLQIPTQFSPHDFHPPLYYMLMSLWNTFFGSSEVALRMPSVIFSLIAGFYVYKIGSFLKDKKTATWATAFFLFNPLIIYYSQEARMYMMATAFLTAALYSLLRVTRDKELNKKHVYLFNIFSALAMLTFYGSAFFILGMILMSLFVIPAQAGIQRKKNQLKIIDWIPVFTGMTWGLFLSLLLLSPLLLQQLNNAKMGLAVVKNWSLVLGKAELRNFLMIFLKFATGRISWFPKWSYYLCAGAATLITWFFIIFGLYDRFEACIYDPPLI